MIEGSRTLGHPKYRPDIDGLRAIAVLAVVAFHAFPRWIPGGFAGVDVFFVISGFLISGIIYDGLDRGNWSWATFYARRAKRIFPALAIVLAACFAFGWLALLSDEYRQLGKHIAGGSAFASNFVLWNESGYFDAAAETKPLLHLWSLGIEEQFYLAWPLLLWTAWKCRIPLAWAALAVAAVSFGLNLRSVGVDPVAAFYSPQTRLWELAMGGLLAAIVRASPVAVQVPGRAPATHAWHRLRERIASPRWRNACSAAGLCLIAASALALSPGSPFPGTLALLPTLGAFLVILGGEAAWPNRALLSRRALVWIGLVSFPLYLWHWPLLAFPRIIESEPPGDAVRIAAVAASLLLAWITYGLVEKPIRRGGHEKAKAVALAAVLAGLFVLGYQVLRLDGIPSRPHAQIAGYDGDIGQLEFHRYVAQRFHVCTPRHIAEEALTWEGYVRCMQSRPDAGVKIALLGDSHAEHLFIGLAEGLPDVNVAFYIKGNVPFLESQDFATIYAHLLSSATIETVILAMNWSRRLEFVPEAVMENEVLRAAGALVRSGKEVYIADAIPVFPFPPEKCKGKRWLARTDSTCEIGRQGVVDQSSRYQALIRRIQDREPRIRLLEIQRHLCDERSCSMSRGDQLLYRDYRHLNIPGSRFVGGQIAEEWLREREKSPSVVRASARR